MTYFVELDIDAEKDLKTHIISGNKILLKRIYKLLEELELHPETGTGKPHRLKHEKSGIWSRSIDDRHRMLYTIDDEKVIVFVISLYLM
ncbi:MAG: Txe/YoeB family addiction module toxin [Tannerellaceae bacterium]|jgi:toxin YoeB|nr:Txe/YoeB family addiction module toxin [Tannerellaceae bacterium]